MVIAFGPLHVGTGPVSLSAVVSTPVSVLLTRTRVVAVARRAVVGPIGLVLSTVVGRSVLVDVGLSASTLVSRSSVGRGAYRLRVWIGLGVRVGGVIEIAKDVRVVGHAAARAVIVVVGLF